MAISRDLFNDEKDDSIGDMQQQQVQVDSKVIVQFLLDELLDAAIVSSNMDGSSIDSKSESLSFNEDDIEKRIKDIRRISENHNQTVSEQDDGQPRGNVIGSFAPSVDLEDRHWKRKDSILQKRRHHSPGDFRHIDISPVQNSRKSGESLCSSPVLQKRGTPTGTSPPMSASTPTLPSSIPWSVTDTAPQIFWSGTRIKTNSDERWCGGFRNQMKSCIGGDLTCESHDEASTDSEEQLDLREILKRRRKSPRLEDIESDNQSIVGIDRIKVTVGTDLETRKVVETDADGGDESHVDDDFELEDGEISDGSDPVNYKEVNSKYNKNLMSTLLKKKKVLEHLIDMVNKEENVDEFMEDNDVFESTVGSMTSLTGDQLRDSLDFEAENLDTFEESSTRKVVYRSSSPDPSSLPAESRPHRNVLNDFNAEMEKGMMNLFPKKTKLSDAAIVKVEPISEEDEITLSDAETVFSTESGSGVGLNARKPPPSSQSTGTGLGKFSCSLCNITVATQRSLKQHWQGKKHQHNLGVAKEGVKINSDVMEGVKRAATDVNDVKKPPRKRIIWDLK